jgi:CheY-like chemotaxis protein
MFASGSVGAGSKTVLLIEDDEDVREEFELALQRAGYQVAPAANGLEALNWLTAQPTRPALILLDWMMPVMDGMSFLGHQASEPRYAAIPVVVVSAVARMAKIPSLCVAAVMAKPVRLRTLVDVVDKLTGRPPRGGSSSPAGNGGDIDWDRPIGRSSGSGGASMSSSLFAPCGGDTVSSRRSNLASPFARVRR